jgi:hypothetical protein
MKQSEIDKILADELSRALADSGFKYVKATKRLSRVTRDISQQISWSYTTRRPGFVISPMLGVRSESILAILKKIQQIRKEDEKFQVALSVDIWRLAGDASRGTFYVETEDDVKSAAAAIAALVRSDALPFFDRCATLGDIDRLFNLDPNSPAARLVSTHNWKRAANALIAARLAENPKYNGLVDVYRATLGQFSGGEFLPQYEALASLLAEAETSATSDASSSRG